MTVSNAGANGVADPGELVHVTVELANLGTLGATALSASLGTGTALVQVPQGASAYPDLTLGATGTNMVDFEVAVGPDFVCGDPIALQLVVTYAGGISPSTTLEISRWVRASPTARRFRWRRPWPFPTILPPVSPAR